ncbi:MAG: mechanosensitive ion channel family protein, partial [Acidobacteriota bacterium]|nr:mechanosensitive ion channel family protein [Acidobacteriota bacterium]
GITGKVEEISLFTSIIDTPDNRRFIVPNSEVFDNVIENKTYHPTRRVDISVGTDYSADLDHTREVLMAAAEAVPGRLEDPSPQVVLQELGGSSIDWSVRVWSTTADFWTVREATVRQVKVALDEAGIGIPFPQMDVHMDRTDS